jgi:threonine dehydratase
MTSWKKDLKNNMQDFNHHHCITFQDVLDAAQNIQGIAYKTPVMTCSSIGSLIISNNNNNDENDNNDNNHNHLDLFFKVEALQRTGSFKFRGALNAIQSLIIAAASNDHEEEGIMIHSSHDNKNKKQGNATSNSTTTATAATATTTTTNNNNNHNSSSNSNSTNTTNNHTSTTLHVVTHSSGNHAAAVALAAKLSSQSCLSKQHSHSHPAYKNHIQSTIVMPKNAPTIKVEGVKGFGGGNIVMVESTNEAREEKANEIVSQTGAYFIHPSENPRVIAGQGTVCLEFVQQVREWTGGDDLDVVIIPVGGGGLAAGNAIALRGLLGDRVKVRI